MKIIHRVRNRARSVIFDLSQQLRRATLSSDVNGRRGVNDENDYEDMYDRTDSDDGDGRMLLISFFVLDRTRMGFVERSATTTRLYAADTCRASAAD